MNRFFLGNFDFEDQLRGEVNRPARLERLCLELASSWLAIADAGDRIWCPGELPEEFLSSLSQWGFPADIFVTDASRIPRGMELVPWGWSPAAVEFGHRHGLVVEAPPLDVVRLANSREYSVPLESPPDDDGDFATLCRTLGEALACVERLPATTAWVIKANWSHAARDRILGRGPVISPADIQWVKQRLARDGVVCWELWLQREAEIGIQWHIPRGGSPQLVAITELLVDARGQYAGTRALAASRGVGVVIASGGRRKSGVSLTSGQLGNEGGVFGGGEAELEDGEDTFEILRQKRRPVEPEARNRYGAENAVLVGSQFDERILLASVPDDPAMAQDDDDILFHAVTLVLIPFPMQVDRLGGQGDLHDQLRCPGKVIAPTPRLPSVPLEDEECLIRLRLERHSNDAGRGDSCERPRRRAAVRR